MLSDRPYMRGDNEPERTTVVTWLICSLVAAFVLQFVSGSLERQLGLSVSGLQSGQYWTLLTHGFLHDRGNLLHLVFNLSALYFLGRELLPVLGNRRLLGVCAVAVIAGGLAWAGVHWGLGAGRHIGATAAVDALVVIYACFYPNQRISFLFLFVFPVTFKPKHLALALAGLDLVCLGLYELPGAAMPFDISVASSAHLAGMAVGWVYFRYFHRARWTFAARRARVESGSAPGRPLRRVPAVSTAPAQPASRGELRAEVDRVLDKINSKGFAALTAEEKRLLDDAKDLLSRR